jgi:hypothetical protein
METKLNFWQKLCGAYDNFTKNAFSARKLTAWAIVFCVVIGHGFYYYHCYKKEDFSIFDKILIIDYIAAGFFLGLITVQQIVEFKNGSKQKPNENNTPNPDPTNIV